MSQWRARDVLAHRSTKERYQTEIERIVDRSWRSAAVTIL